MQTPDLAGDFAPSEQLPELLPAQIIGADNLSRHLFPHFSPNALQRTCAIEIQ